MKCRVILEDSAHKDLEAITLWLAQRSTDAANKWYWQVREAIETLAESPLRCLLAPENELFPEEIRHLFYGRKRYVYRILFTVKGSHVHVLHVRHGSRKPLHPNVDE
jgi:plasmid stabilization system protein ParE